MRQLISTTMEIIRGNTDVEVHVDGYVDASQKRYDKKLEVEVTGVTDIDAWFDTTEQMSCDVILTPEERAQAEQLLTEKLLEKN